MKKIGIIILAFLMMCGCSMPASDESIPNTEDTSVTDTTASNSTESNAALPGVIPADFPVDGSFPYFIESNCDIDFFQDSNLRSFSVMLISDREIQLSDIDVNVPIQTPYTFRMEEYFRGEAPSAYQTQSEDSAFVLFPYELYLCYCGFDWAEYGAKCQKLQDILNDPQYENSPIAKQQAYQAAETECRETYNALWDEYIQLEQTMIPSFHPYIISVELDTTSTTEEEIVSSVEITISGETYTVDIGEIRLHPENGSQRNPECFDYMGNFALGGFAPITEKTNTFDVAFYFIAKEEMILHNFAIHHTDGNYGDVYVNLAGAEQTVNVVWEQGSDIYVSEGSRVSISTTLTDERMLENGFSLHLWPCLDFEVNGEQNQFSYTQFIYDMPNFYEEYAKHFHGIDTDSYYTDYYLPNLLGIDTQS